MNSRKKNKTFFGNCKICHDKATGVHYGVTSCEGCKNFYKRNITNQNEHTCFFNNKCILKHFDRNKCKSCRFRLCLEAGMSLKGTKIGRIPNSKKQTYITPEKETVTPIRDALEADHKPLKCTVLEMNQSSDSKDEFREKMFSLNFEHHEYFINLIKERAKILNDKGNYNQNITLDTVWEGIEIGINTATHLLENFVKEIPGFNEIVETLDFRVIINNHLFDYLILKNFLLLTNNESNMVLPNDISFSKYWLVKAFSYEIADSIMDFSNKLNSLELTSREISLIYPVILSIDDEFFKNKQWMKLLHHKYSLILCQEFYSNNRDVNFFSKFQKIIVSRPKMDVSYLKSIKQFSYEFEARERTQAREVNQDSETTKDGTIEWLQKFTDFDIDEYLIDILKNT